MLLEEGLKGEEIRVEGHKKYLTTRDKSFTVSGKTKDRHRRSFGKIEMGEGVTAWVKRWG
jgi:hypothetical protein